MNDNLAVEKLYERFSRYNTEVLELMGKTIKQFQGLTPSQAHKLARQLKNGVDIRKIIKELEKISGLSKKDIIEILEITAKQDIKFAEPYYKYRNKTNSFQKSKEFQDIVKSVAKVSAEPLENIANTTVIMFKNSDGKFIPKDLKKAYIELIDRCVIATSTGIEDYQTMMRKTIKELSNSGIRKIYYDNRGKTRKWLNPKTGEIEDKKIKETYTRRLDTTVRQNLLDGIRQVHNETQLIIGEEIGADGVEISAHSMCAEDHQEIQGKQYKKADFEKLNGNLERPIGTLNCYHTIFSVVLGVQKPIYTDGQLNNFIKESNKKIKFEGKEYTKYECTQLQRKIESAIRQQKDEQILNRASGFNDDALKNQKKIRLLTQKYNELSKESGLPTKKNRLTVSGYHKIGKKD